MIRVQFFARYREVLGCAEASLTWTPDLATMGDLRAHLMRRGGVWAETLSEQGLMCARNEELCGLAEPLRDGDDVAFFPTVTGG